MVGTVPGKIVFATTDYWGNSVHLPERSWQHIRDRHPEMAHHEDVVLESVESPDGFRASSQRPDTCAAVEVFGGGPDGVGVRTLIEYRDNNFLAGTTSGKVITAYPLDGKFSSQVGPLQILKGGTE